MFDALYLSHQNDAEGLLMNNPVKPDENLVAYCGLYCGVCKSYTTGKCKGCRGNTKSDSWCKVKSCCRTNTYNTCAECTSCTNSTECKKLNNFVSKIFSILFRSNRNACIRRIKEIGRQGYAEEMEKKRQMTVK